MSCQAARLLGDAFLHTAVADEGVGLMCKDFAEVCCNKAFGNGTSHCHHMALSQRTAGVLNAMLHVKFGVSWCDAAPRAEGLDVIDGVLSGH